MRERLSIDPDRVVGLRTMIKNMPNTFSLLVQKAAIKRMTMVIGTAAMVKPNSLSVRLTTTTRN